MARSSQKRDAILAIGLDRPTTEILEAAAASGVTVSRAYVDLLKKGSDGRGPAAKKRGTRSAAGATNAARPPAAAADADAAFRAAAVALVLQGGMATAREALAAVVEQVRASVNMA